MSDDDVLERWERAVEHYWAETSSSCSECLVTFATGDVCVVFGDMQVAAAKKFYLCSQCGYQAIVSGNVPAATSIFIETKHRSTKLSKLDEKVRDRVLEAFQIVDQIHSHMTKLVAQAGGLASDPTKGPPS